MSTASLLMIHNAWSWTSGNANELRKQADDLDKITQASINAYMQEVNITEEELKQMLDNETWITPQEALEMGFSTAIVNEKEAEEVSQSVKKSLMKLILNAKKDDDDNKDGDNDDNSDDNNDDNDNDNNDDNNDNNNDDDDDKEPKESKIDSFFNVIKNLNN